MARDPGSVQAPQGTGAAVEGSVQGRAGWDPDAVHEPRPQALRVRRLGRLGHYRPQLGVEGEESSETEEGKGSYHPEEEDGRPRLRALRVVRWALFLLSGSLGGVSSSFGAIFEVCEFL